MSGSVVEWVPTNPFDAPHSLGGRAVVGGYEAADGGPLWVIRAEFEGDLMPGKLAVKRHEAFVPWGGKENSVLRIEVCCAPPEKIKWVEASYAHIPPNAIEGGHTSSGETLYIGRAKEQDSLIPGKVQPSLKALYICYGGEEILSRFYEILCTA